MHSSRQIGVVKLRLQLGVIDDVVVAERLLDHHQVELVQPSQMVDVGERVGGVCVRHQLDLRESACAPRATTSTSQPGLIFILMR